ncbi:MAG: signal peptidase II [Desulfovibrio sp.]
MKARFLKAFAWALLVLVPDQITKGIVQDAFTLWESREVIPGFFSLTLVHNMGAAFGFLNTSDIDWQTPFFVCATIVAVAFLLYLIKEEEGRGGLMLCGLGLILGGALGNLVDRLSHRYVIDFLDFHLGGWHWPAFNVADSGITLGAAAIILSYWLRRDHVSDVD